MSSHQHHRKMNRSKRKTMTHGYLKRNKCSKRTCSLRRKHCYREIIVRKQIIHVQVPQEGLGNISYAAVVGTVGSVGTAGSVAHVGSVATAGTVGNADAVGTANSVGTANVINAQGVASPSSNISSANSTSAAGAGAVATAGNVGSVGAIDVIDVIDINNEGCERSVGVTGATGPTGATGVPGPTGPTNPNQGLTQFGYIYNLEAQVVGMEADVIFDTHGILTSGITHDPGTSHIEVIHQGIYEITFFLSYVESGHFALFVNDIQVPGSQYGSGIGTELAQGQVIIALSAGDFITLRNDHPTVPATLQSQAGGLQNTVNASVVIKKLA